jgi:hypothetical protein
MAGETNEKRLVAKVLYASPSSVLSWTRVGEWPRADVKNVRALDDFYGSLSDEQKEQFNLIGRQQTARQC